MSDNHYNDMIAAEECGEIFQFSGTMRHPKALARVERDYKERTELGITLLAILFASYVIMLAERTRSLRLTLLESIKTYPECIVVSLAALTGYLLYSAFCYHKAICKTKKKNLTKRPWHERVIVTVYRDPDMENNINIFTCTESMDLYIGASLIRIVLGSPGNVHQHYNKDGTMTLSVTGDIAIRIQLPKLQRTRFGIDRPCRNSNDIVIREWVDATPNSRGYRWMIRNKTLTFIVDNKEEHIVNANKAIALMKETGFTIGRKPAR